jgi:hypothetical protein
MRAKSEEPFISMPIAWQELSRAVKGGDQRSLSFTPAAAIKRIKQVGDLFDPVLTLPAKATFSLYRSTRRRTAPEAFLMAT